MLAVEGPFVGHWRHLSVVCLLAFTSGTTGEPKATMHFHRDVLIMADVVGRHLLETGPDDIYAGSPPLGFTFGLGALLVFPAVSGGNDHDRTAVRGGLAERGGALQGNLPLHRANASDGWHDVTGIRLIDGLGATEMIHIFLSAKGDDIRPSATGKPLPGYQAVVLDDNGQPQLAGKPGRLAVRGPTGCRYLADARQREYVVNGWNITGDRYLIDEEGYFRFQARADDMIVSSGYTIAGPEVESTLARHSAVSEVAVIGVPDEERGQIVKAFVVLEPGITQSALLTRELQEFVKASIAPYKYPRAIEFVPSLPKTATGKIQRFVLREHSGRGMSAPR